MELADVLERRRSCRSFLAYEVPTETLREIFTAAQRTASWCNTQPWQVHLLSGEARQRLSKELVESVMAGQSGNDLPMPEQYVGIYDERRREAGYGLYNAVGIARDDKAARAEQMLANYNFFGAPHVAIITTDVHQGLYGAADCGGFVANVLNAATGAGLGSIAQAAIAMQSPTVRRVLELPEERRIFCAISLGYADPDHPANTFRTSRAEVDDVLTFVE
jgi:nitroreductase